MILPIMNPITKEWLIFNDAGHSETVTNDEYQYIRKRDTQIVFKTRYAGPELGSIVTE